MNLRRSVLCAAAVGAGLLIAPEASAAPTVHVIVIQNMKFGPLPAQIHKGDAIIWINRDFLRHSATANDHSFDVDLPPNARAKTVLAKSGVIPFSCRYHPGMRGVFQVK
jgi:plastocyanin